MELKINEELKDLIPPLTEMEKLVLEESIKQEGCRDALIVWNGVLVDGHNRYEICKRNNIPFKTINKEFNNEDEVKLWMIDNQQGRRNLTDGWKFELAQKKKEILLKKGKETQGKRTDILSQSDKKLNDKGVDKHNTQVEIAKNLGWATGKVAKAEVVWKNADQEVKEQIKKGEKTFSEVYTEIKKEERLEKINKQRENLEKEVLEKPKGLFDVMVIDPPWRYDGDGDVYNPDGNRGTTPYPTMTLEEIKNIKLPCKEDCVLWLWTTNKFILDMKPLLEEWGFEVKTILTWDKEHIGTGRWLRSQTEHCILAIKGKPYFNNTKWSTIIKEKRTEHSTKPEIFYKMVEEICAGRKLDYFARKKREGWDVFGDEIN